MLRQRPQSVPAHRKAQLAERAHSMRTQMTPSEAALWRELRSSRLGVAFRRQVPIGGKFIADFLAPSIRLVVEVDGGYHATRVAADARKDRALHRLGYTVLHLEARVVEWQLLVAVQAVREAVQAACMG